MRIVFAGTPDFAARSLAALIAAAPAAGWSLPLVLTQPDRPAGRGLRLTPSPVKSLALAHGLTVHTPVSLRKGPDAEAAQRRIAAVEPDVLIVAAYGLILPQSVLDIPRGLGAGWSPKLSAINVHASLLPRWRGAAPIARAIEAGDRTTGITIMQMDAGLDTGPMLLAESIDIDADETAGHLTTRLADLGATLLVRALGSIDELSAQPQPAAGATYAAKIDKSEAWLDWSLPAAVLARKVRAYDPFPVAHTRTSAECFDQGLARDGDPGDGRGGAGHDRRSRCRRHRRALRRGRPAPDGAATCGRQATPGTRISGGPCPDVAAVLRLRTGA